jgi:hypothetical protein
VTRATVPPRLLVTTRSSSPCPTKTFAAAGDAALWTKADGLACERVSDRAGGASRETGSVLIARREIDVPMALLEQRRSSILTFSCRSILELA